MSEFNKIDPEKLLSTLHHDMVNMFFGIAVANDATSKYFDRLLKAYRRLADAEKTDIHISENALQLIEQNFSNITQEISYSGFYVNSMRYNFCDYSNYEVRSVNVASLIPDAKSQKEKSMQS